MFGRKNPNEYTGDWEQKYTEYWAVKLDTRCMSCSIVHNLTLNFQERIDMRTDEYDLQYLPKEYDYMAHVCETCDKITVSKIQKIESIKSQKYSKGVEFEDY